MGTTADKRYNAALRRRAKKAWVDSKLETFTTSQLVEHLNKGRTFFMRLMMSQLEAGELDYVKYCIDRVSEITKLFEDIENGKAQADIGMAKTIWAQPIMLDGVNCVDLNHFLEEGRVDVDA